MNLQRLAVCPTRYPWIIMRRPVIHDVYYPGMPAYMVILRYAAFPRMHL